jgi:hypothetical protein
LSEILAAREEAEDGEGTLVRGPFVSLAVAALAFLSPAA